MSENRTSESNDSIKWKIQEAYARQSVPSDFPHMPDIPVSRYISDEFWQLEQQLWPRTWLFAAHADELPEVGSFKLFQDAGVPIVLVREEQGEVRAYYNTCQHRGGPLVVTEYGQQARLRCGYHGWTYNFSGELIAVPDQRDFVALDMACHRLQALRCESWHNWIFINRHADAESLANFMQPVAAELQQFDLDNLRFISRSRIPIAANWKACVDSFMETYHLKHIHPHTVDRVLDHKGTVISLLANGHNKMYTPNREGYVAPVPGFADISSVGELPRITNLAYSVFPNLVMPLDTGGFPLLCFWPIDKRNTRLDVLWLAPPQAGITGKQQLWLNWQQQLPQIWLDRLAIFHQVLAEDTEFLPWQQKSMETGAIKAMPLSFLEQRIYHRQSVIDDMIGRERIPPEMQVAPVLDDLIEI